MLPSYPLLDAVMRLRNIRVSVYRGFSTRGCLQEGDPRVEGDEPDSDCILSEHSIRDGDSEALTVYCCTISASGR